MIKKNKWKLAITSIVTLLPILAGLILWSRLPEKVPIHFGKNGVADGWSSKQFAVFALPVFLLLVHWVVVFFTMLDPKAKNINGKVFGIVLWACPVVSLFGAMATYTYALGYNVNVELIAFVFIGALFIVIGNYLPKCKQNYTVGIKIPWTLNDEGNWNHTHRFAGWVWVAGGIIVMLTSFFRQYLVFLVVTALIVLIPVVYSYIYFRKHNKDKE